MRYVAAYMLAVLGGTKSPDDKALKKILSSVGIDADDALVKKVLSELKGKKIEDVIAAGQEKLASVPSGGGAAVAAGGPAAAAPAEEKKEEAKKEESAEESDEDMGFGLFD